VNVVWRRGLTGAALSCLLLAPSLASADTFAPAKPGRIIFSRDTLAGPGSVYDVHAINPDGSGLVNLTPGLATNQLGVSIDPAGARIAFRNGDGTAAAPFDIWTQQLDGSPAVPLTSDTPSDVAPTFSPDGRQIAFMRDFDLGPGNDFDLMVIGADGSGLRNLTNTPGVSEFAPSFAPDGSHVIFHAEGAGGFNELNQVGIDGTGRAPLGATASLPGDEESPVLSPDGRRLAFVNISLPDVDVFVAAGDGSNPVNLTASWSPDASNPAWSPDGSRLVWDDDGGDLFTIPAAGGSATALTTGAQGNTAPEWEHVFSCAGRRATIVGDEGPDRIKGTKRADVIVANAGKDVISARGGNDRICGGKGKDKLRGNGGRDRIFGQAGKDGLVGGKGPDTLRGGKGKDSERQ
jgi:Tol biopolymer transport system component